MGGLEFLPSIISLLYHYPFLSLLSSLHFKEKGREVLRLTCVVRPVKDRAGGA